MTKFVLDDYAGPTLDYSSLGFRADVGDILSATAAPDARWSVNGDQGAAETVERYTLGIVDPSYIEPTDGHVLAWDDAQNAYVPTAPESATAATLAAYLEDPDSAPGALLDARYGTSVTAALSDVAFDALLAALPDGAHVNVPAGVTVTLNDDHVLPKPVIIGGEGTLKDARTNPSTPLLTIPTAASGARIYCRLEGSVAGQYKAGHHAIYIEGDDNGASTAPTYVEDLVLKPASISGFGSSAIFGEFVKDYVIDVDVIHDMGYGGILLLSAINGDAHVRRLRDLTPGTSSNVYALQFTCRDSSDRIRYPLSRNFNGYVGEMHGVDVWDGVGTHGGQDGTLGWGSMYDVKKPFDVVAASGADGETAYAPNNITINQGSADSGVTNGTFGPAGTISGAFKTTDSLGSPTEYAKGIVVNPGSVKGYGIQGSANSGAYYCVATQGIKLDVSCLEPSPYAVCFYHDNKDFHVSAKAIDPWTTDHGHAGVINVSSDYNTGMVDFSGATRGSKSATIVLSRGLTVKNVASNVVRVGAANDFFSATLPVSGPASAWFDVALKLGAQIQQGLGSAGAPTYSFDGDTNTGMYSSTADDISFATGGTRRVRIGTSAVLLSEGYNLSFGTTTGSLIGTAATQKMGFYGTTPIVRPSSTPAAATDAATTQALVNDLRTKLLALGLIS